MRAQPVLRRTVIYAVAIVSAFDAARQPRRPRRLFKRWSAYDLNNDGLLTRVNASAPPDALSAIELSHWSSSCRPQCIDGVQQTGSEAIF